MLVDDPVRRRAILGSLQGRVGPESVVLDLGAGVGLLAVLCCRLGARHVYAVDTNPGIRFLSGLAARNGCVDRITWYHADSRTIDLPEKVDIIIADIRGGVSVVGGSFDIVSDAVARFLKPGGYVIPVLDRIQVAAVTENAVVNELNRLWVDNDLGVDLSSIHGLEMGHMRISKARSEDLLSNSLEWAEINWVPIPRIEFRRELIFTIIQRGRLDGFISWFDLTFDEDHALSNNPSRDHSIYGRAVFLLSRPIVVELGWRVSLRLRLYQNKTGEVWSWSGAVFDPAGRVEVSFSESSIKGQALFGFSQKGATS